MIAQLNNLRLTIKLPVFILGATFFVALAIGVVSFLTAQSQQQAQIQQKGEALLQAKRDELSNYLAGIEQDLRVVAANDTVLTALKAFEGAWNEIAGSPAEVLQAAYIENNPHPTGEKEKLDKGDMGGRYDKVHAAFHPWFRKLLQERSYYDIFLFDSQGDLLYTVFKELDYATNVQSGKYKDTDLGNAFRAAAEGGKPNSIHFFDFKPYSPSHGAPASFMSTPIYENGSKIGVLVFQMPIDIINAMMSKDAGLGTTGEVMIVGSDKLLRNDSRFTKENDILKSRIDNAAITSALAGKPGTGNASDYRKLSLDYIAIPLDYRGVRFALATAQSADEINAPIASMRNQILLIGAGLLAVVALFGIFVSRTLTAPVSGLVGQMKQLAEGDTSFEITADNRGDEIGDMAQAVAVFRQNAIERVQLETESETDQRQRAEREARIDELIGQFREKAVNSLTAVSSNAGQMKTSAETLSSIASSTSERANSANEASGHSANNVQSVAAATEQMTTSVNEIGQQVSKANDLIAEASNEAQDTDQKVASLASAAEKIGDVVSLIQEIAEQTNLLALNATIEAARAGEAGKGFAVVASEVKELASQTGQATEEIASQISGIQSETSDAVAAIQSIAKKMVDVSEFTVAIASAVDEQNASTGEITRNVQEAAQGTQMVVENITEVSTSAGETNASSEQLLEASQNVAKEADHMREIVDSFLKDVAAA